MKIVCKQCAKELIVPEIKESGVPYEYIRCECGEDNESPIKKPSQEDWEIMWESLIYGFEKKEDKEVVKEMTDFMRKNIKLHLKEGYEEDKTLISAIVFPSTEIINEIMYQSNKPWPENALIELNECKYLLEKEGMNVNEVPMFVGGLSDKTLDHFCYPPTTYSSILRKNNVCVFGNWDHRILDDEGYLIWKEKRVHIMGIKYNYENPCGFCGEPITLGFHAEKLSDGKLVCGNCQIKVYNKVLTP